MVDAMSWRFVLRPKWILGHLLIIALAALMLALAFWQFDRLHERRRENAVIRAALSAPALDIETTRLPPGATEYRAATITGTWQSDKTVFKRYPLRNGASGFEVLTPFAIDGGSILVDRGWIPLDKGRTAAEQMSDAHGGPVTISGRLYRAQVAHKPTGTTSGNPPVPTLTAVDPTRVGELLHENLAPMWLALQQSTNADDPLPLEEPQITEGPHFSYAMQWLGFLGVGLAGYGVILVKTAREEGRPKHRQQT